MSDALDRLAAAAPVNREVYGHDESNKPNDYCYWDNERGYWSETDQHLRGRIEARMHARRQVNL